MYRFFVTNLKHKIVSKTLGMQMKPVSQKAQLTAFDSFLYTPSDLISMVFGPQHVNVISKKCTERHMKFVMMRFLSMKECFQIPPLARRRTEGVWGKTRRREMRSVQRQTSDGWRSRVERPFAPPRKLHSGNQTDVAVSCDDSESQTQLWKEAADKDILSEDDSETQLPKDQPLLQGRTEEHWSIKTGNWG